MRWRFLPAIITFLITLAVLLPGVRVVPQHGDEGHYALTAVYFGGRVAHLDFSPDSRDDFVDPGWSPYGYWSLTQPMSVRFLYAAALGLTAQPAPTKLWDFTGPVQPLDTQLAPLSLLVLRLTAILCASLGLALLAFRFRWTGLLAAVLLLLIPHMRADLTRAWAEGPLLLGFGLCAVAFGTRWFGVACGIAATVKLTALGLWPLLLFRRANGGRRWSNIVGILSACAVWTVLTPPSWFLGGPLYLPFMLSARTTAYASQSASAGQPGYEGIAGVFLPTRYLLPLELAAVLALSYGLVWLWHHRPFLLLARQPT